MLILKIKDPKIEKMLREVLMRSACDSPEKYISYAIQEGYRKLRLGPKLN